MKSISARDIMNEGGDHMKQGIFIIVMITSLFFVSSCSSHNPLEVENDTISRQVKHEDSNAKNSPYIKQLPVDKQKSFARFKDEKDLSALYHFTPDEMVLVYLYCLSIDDANLLYEITFNDDQLPDKDKFKQDYVKYVMKNESEIAIHSNYYNAITIDERTFNGKSGMVIISDGTGSSKSVALMLRKEDQVWKIDFYSLMKKYIK